MKTFVENGITHLDLHGVRHHEVNELVLDFVLRNQESIPLVIILFSFFTSLSKSSFLYFSSVTA